jgi:hypothetical protein
MSNREVQECLRIVDEYANKRVEEALAEMPVAQGRKRVRIWTAATNISNAIRQRFGLPRKVD